MSKCDQVVRAFFEATRSVGDAYKHSTFSYLAAVHGGEEVLLHGRIFLRPIPSDRPFSHIRVGTIFAGQYRLSELVRSPEEIVAMAMKGAIETPDGLLKVPCSQQGELNCQFEPIHSDGLLSQSRIGVLTVKGGPVEPYIPEDDVDWLVKAADEPFENLADLKTEYALGASSDAYALLEVIAHGVAQIDGSSHLKGQEARVRVRVAKTLPANRTSVGYRVLSQRRVIERKVITAEKFTWTEEQETRVGEATISVPTGSVVYCIARAGGVAQHFYWLLDPANSQNPRRVAYETADPELKGLRDILAGTTDKQRNAREFESVVSWVLWMMGFATAHFGNTPKVQEAADLIAVSPSGNFMIVECTTGLLRADNKLSNLVARTEMVKKRLGETGNGYAKVLAVMVTSRTRDEVAADMEIAEKTGVLVITRDSFEDEIRRTLLYPDADNTFSLAERSVGERKAKWGTQKGAT